jgi:serine/threonine protein kinase
VGFLHRRDLLHLDIKPANIVADGGRAKLIDLSLARRPGRARGGAGTYQYMAPEQARGGLLTTAADVWGIGAVLFAALAGEPPFGYGTPTGAGDALADSATDAGYPQLRGRAPLLTRVPVVPRAVAELVDGCLEPDPLARPSIAELSAGLDAWLDPAAGP